MLGIIGGTGFGEFAGLEKPQDRVVETQWGAAELQFGELSGHAVVFLPRHGMPPRNPPHRINYRANIQALSDVGVTRILAVTAVGTVSWDLAVPAVVVPDQIIDYTQGRAQTYFDNVLHHIDFTHPFDLAMRRELIDILRSMAPNYPGLVFSEAGTYGCTEGPRLETAAEIARLRQDGCHIVGMTAMPEAALARELDIPYAGLSVTVNPGAGMVDRDITLPEIEAAMTEGLEWVKEALRILVTTSASSH